jgi:diguanylate cyclase (GGDEF)-like protein
MFEGQLIKIVCVMLVLLGSVIHIYYFNAILKIARSLKYGHIRNRLVWLTLLTGLFSALYLVFALFSTQAEDIELILLATAILFLMVFFVMTTGNVLVDAFGVVRNVELMEKQRISDESMGIYNRVYFDMRLKEAYSLAKRHQQNFSVLLIEIDYLDQIGRSHGLEYTGKFLASLGKLIKTSVRETDIVARYGREEMAILLPNTDLSGAKIAVKKIRNAVENKAFYLDDSGEINRVMVSCTVSIGVATYISEIKSPDEIMHRADIALFKAKDRGRNQAAVYGE